MQTITKNLMHELKALRRAEKNTLQSVGLVYIEFIPHKEGNDTRHAKLDLMKRGFNTDLSGH